ncbi:cytochrome o ubiquinol oxidase subunit IV [Bartonella sp. F02]|uniref:cytochrome o ubiquinol oxidase subunit IV n=1 Tax=Bartonella sp. F02 TaxID=2967262 RepID=UPI0022A90B0B|nr:cytochrome o ubiquinol oxidase subunit IV [Bartonella sp. F02]MCZ2328038.1 cytochrome o ubiquinol oxidase subunit IV [Bartonella sp. F02]
MSSHNKVHDPSTVSYLIGFVLAVFLTLGSFLPVMYGILDSWAISTKVIYLIGMALIQITVQIVFFLHLNSGPDAKWNLGTLYFAAACVFIIIGGTWWAISHLNYNMMGGSGRIVEPKILKEVNEPVAVKPSSDPQIPAEQLSNEQILEKNFSNDTSGVEMPINKLSDSQNPKEELSDTQAPAE